MKKILLSIAIPFFLLTSIYSQTTMTLEEMLTHISKDSLQRTVMDMQGFTTRYAPEGNIAVAEYVKSRLEQYGVAAEIDSFFLEMTPWFTGVPIARYMYNVKGKIPGSTHSDSIVIIGAHIDAINLNTSSWPWVLITDITPGADDNASGVAVFIELARMIQKLELIPLATISFMGFDAEEIGLHGAHYDARKRLGENENIIVMLNNDMVSYQPTNEEYKLNVHWYDNAIPEANKAVELSEEYTSITPLFLSEDDNEMRQNSDSWAYAERGFHALFFIEHHFTPYYHTSSDLYEYSNFDFLKEVAKLNFVLLDYYAKFESTIDDDDTLTNVNLNPLSMHVKVFPNPAVDYIDIETDQYSHVEYSVKIFDLWGRLCLSSVFSGRGKRISLADMESGLYFVQVSSSKGSQVTQKIIKR